MLNIPTTDRRISILPTQPQCGESGLFSAMYPVRYNEAGRSGVL
jgi:hypothetical protein